MTTFQHIARIAAFALCTLVASVTLVTGAVGPAAMGQSPATHVVA